MTLRSVRSDPALPHAPVVIGAAFGQISQGSPDACGSSSARHLENQGRPNDGGGETPPHEAAPCLGLHCPPAAGHSSEPAGHRTSSAFWSSPPWNFGFVSAPPPRPSLT